MFIIIINIEENNSSSNKKKKKKRIQGKGCLLNEQTICLNL